MSTATETSRRTKYCHAIEASLARLGHATNARLLDELRRAFPDISATTVHRATARLAQRGTIGIGPFTSDGAMQYDHNISPHDHFQCSICGMLRDTNIKDKIIPMLEDSISDCQISGQLTINGICKDCAATTAVS